MKKIALFLIFSMISTATLLAQNSAVSKATKYLEEGQLDLAKENIDAAVAHEKTKDKSKTWYTKGKVYEAIAQSDNPSYQNLAQEPLVEAVEAYNKVKGMEKENSFQHLQATEALRQLWSTTLNKGAELYEAGDYELAFDQFKKLQRIDPQDTTGYLYAGISAMQSSKFDEVKENYLKLLDLGYKSVDVYSGLIWIEKNHNNNPEKALEIVQQARKALPDNLDIMREEINLLLSMEKKEEALAKTEEAVKAEPDNHSLYYILAYLYDETGQNEKAEENYKKSIELKPDYFDANYNLAVLYFNRGVEYIKEANNLPLSEYQKRGQQIKDQSKKHLQEALPYLLKAHEIKPEDTQVIEIIHTIYAELGNKEKASEFKKKLDSTSMN